MGACGSSEDTDDAKPTKDKSDTTTPDKDKEETVTVTFALNYKEATDTPPVAQTIKKDSKATKPADPTRDGYTFDNWYTDDATTKVFAFDTTIITGDITLYAGWQRTVYTVTFDGNYTGATDTPPDQTIKKGDKATAPTDNPTRTGYTFDNWYDDKTAGNKFVFDTTPITADITLYAKWIQIDCRQARKALTHVVSLYDQGKADTPYLPEKLQGNFVDDSNTSDFLVVSVVTVTIPAGQANELPYINPFGYYTFPLGNARFRTGRFEITPDYIDASLPTAPAPAPGAGGVNTIRISCYSVKEINDNLYFYYGKVRFLLDGQETEAFNKAMYAWTGIDKRDASNKDALYGYMVSIQGNYLRPLKVYPFVGGKYTRSASGTKGTADYVPEKIVIFPRTEAEYAALTLEDLQIIATAPLTSDKLFKGTFFPADVSGIYSQ